MLCSTMLKLDTASTHAKPIDRKLYHICMDTLPNVFCTLIPAVWYWSYKTVLSPLGTAMGTRQTHYLTELAQVLVSPSSVY